MVRTRNNQQRELAAFEMKQELERIQAGLEYEQQLRREKKEKEMQIHRSTVAENEENDRQKLLKKQQEQEEELKRNELYDQRLFAEEQARQNALKKRYEKIEKITQLLDHSAQQKNDHRENDQNEEGEEEGGGTFSWQGANDLQKSRSKQEKLAKIKFENLNLYQTKLEKQKELKMKDLEDGLRLKEETTKYYESEKKRRSQEQQKKKHYGQSLQQQMEEKHHAAMSAMTRPEKSVNQKELKLIQSDPNLHSRIAHRLRMQTAPGTAREHSTLALTRFIAHHSDLLILSQTILIRLDLATTELMNLLVMILIRLFVPCLSLERLINSVSVEVSEVRAGT
jgi:hypothetical protein